MRILTVWRLAAILSLMGSQASALVKQDVFGFPPSKVLIDKVESRYDRQARHNERLVMNEAFQEYLKKAHRGEVFKADNYRKIPDALDNSDLSQSWRDEAALTLDGRTLPREIRLNYNEDLYQHFYLNSPIAMAKKIARAKMYESIQKNWGQLKETVFNDDALDCNNVHNCPGFDEVILGKKMPDKFIYSYPLSMRSGRYVFEFQGVGFVEVSKDLKSGRVVFGISYLNDLNRPERGYENLRTDVDAGIIPPPATKTDDDKAGSPPSN